MNKPWQPYALHVLDAIAKRLVALDNVSINQGNITMAMQLLIYQGHEIAFMAGTTKETVDRLVDDGCLDAVRSPDLRRRVFGIGAAILIRQYLESDRVLLKSARKLLLLQLAPHVLGPKLPTKRTVVCKVDNLQVNVKLQELIPEIRKRLNQIQKARAMITKDPAIMGGAPVIKGTRIRVQDVAALLNGGESVDAIQSIYPRLDENQILLSQVYDRVVPRRGRPPAKRSGRLRSQGIIKPRTAHAQPKAAH